MAGARRIVYYILATGVARHWERETLYDVALWEANGVKAIDELDDRYFSGESVRRSCVTDESAA